MTVNQKAQSVFKKLGVVALITATTLTLAMFFTACNQTGNTGGSGSGGGKPTPTPTDKTYTVDGVSFMMKEIAAVENGNIDTLM